MTQLRAALVALCVTEIVSWGVLYYAFAVLSGDIATDTGWRRTEVTGTFSAALVVAAVAGIPVGRIIHRHGPRWLMTGGSVLGSLALLGVARAETLPEFAVAWVCEGVAMSTVLYAPAFAAVTVWFGVHRVGALTAITLVAGLASTVFAPLTAAINDQVGWRDTYVVLAAVLAVVTVPLHAIALRPMWPRSAGTEPAGHGTPDRPRVSRRDFALLATGFSLSAAGLHAALVNLVPLLQSRGYSAGVAATVLGVGGVGQVAGRLGYAPLTRRVRVRPRATLVLLLGATTSLLFAVTAGPVWALVGVAVLAGNARGIVTLLQATAVSDRWGVERYARLNGVFAAPLMVATAVAPFLGAGLTSLLGSYPAAFAVLSAVGLVGAVLTNRGFDDGPPQAAG